MSRPITRDCFGRIYRMGPAPEDLIGRSRHWMTWLPWAAMAATGASQYGYGSLVPAMVADGRSPAEAVWPLAVWAVFQALTGFPVAYLRERGRLEPRALMVSGAVLMCAGVFCLAHLSPVGFALLGGTGAGLVYATCTSTVAKWHPERMADRVSFVTGSFAYGAVPFALGFLFAPTAVTLDIAAVAIAAVVAGAGLLFRDPPPDWWPADVDPRTWALKRPRAAREFSLAEAVRTGVFPVMCTVLLIASAVSLFTAVFFADLATRLDAGPLATAVGIAVLLGANGAGRSLAIRLAERTGRRRAVIATLGVQTAGQLFLAGAASSGSVGLLLVSAVVAGAGGGAFYPLFASLVREYFGERDPLRTHAVVYSAKAFGALTGIGLAATVVPQWGYPTVLLLSAVLALGATLLAHRLRRPGHVRTLPLLYVVDRVLANRGGAQ